MQNITKNNTNQKKYFKWKTLYPNEDWYPDTGKKLILKRIQYQRNNLKEFLDWSIEQDDFGLEEYKKTLKEIATNNYSTCEIDCKNSLFSPVSK